MTSTLPACRRDPSPVLPIPIEILHRILYFLSYELNSEAPWLLNERNEAVIALRSRQRQAELTSLSPTLNSDLLSVALASRTLYNAVLPFLYSRVRLGTVQALDAFLGYNTDQSVKEVLSETQHMVIKRVDLFLCRHCLDQDPKYGHRNSVGRILAIINALKDLTRVNIIFDLCHTATKPYHSRQEILSSFPAILFTRKIDFALGVKENNGINVASTNDLHECVCNLDRRGMKDDWLGIEKWGTSCEWTMNDFTVAAVDAPIETMCFTGYKYIRKLTFDSPDVFQVCPIMDFVIMDVVNYENKTLLVEMDDSIPLAPGQLLTSIAPRLRELDVLDCGDHEQEDLLLLSEYLQLCTDLHSLRIFSDAFEIIVLQDLPKSITSLQIHMDTLEYLCLGEIAAFLHNLPQLKKLEIELGQSAYELAVECECCKGLKGEEWAELSAEGRMANTVLKMYDSAAHLRDLCQARGIEVKVMGLQEPKPIIEYFPVLKDYKKLTDFFQPA